MRTVKIRKLSAYQRSGPAFRLAALGARPPLRKRGGHDSIRPRVHTRLRDARIDALIDEARNESR